MPLNPGHASPDSGPPTSEHVGGTSMLMGGGKASVEYSSIGSNEGGMTKNRH